MKHKIIKILSVLMVIVIATVFVLPTISNYGTVSAGTDDSLILDILTSVLGLFIGLTTLGTRLKVFAISLGTSSIISSIAGLGTDVSGQFSITPVSIFFNKLQILDINFFDFNPPNAGPDSIIVSFRTTIATWYYVMRLLATAILLLVLIYVGIRMAISTVASDKALYKKMLVDWVASLALIYLLHYFIIFIISINEILVGIMEETSTSLFESQGIDKFQLYLMLNSLNFVDGFTGIVCTIVYLFIIWQTVKFIFLYFKRLLTVGFLIVVAPLITLTYSLDKMGDGKAQALGTWTKEFCYNILIQPFHCVLYLAFVNIAMVALGNHIGTSAGSLAIAFITPAGAGPNNSLGIGILAIMCLNFIDKGEEIIRNIFGFSKASSLTSAVAAAGAVTAMAGNAKALGQTGAKMFQGARSSAQLMGNRVRNASKTLDSAAKRLESSKDKRLTRQAEKQLDKGKVTVADKDEKGNELTREARVQLARDAIKAQKDEKKANSRTTKFKRKVKGKAADAKDKIAGSAAVQQLKKKTDALNQAVKKNTVDRYRNNTERRNARRREKIEKIENEQIKSRLGEDATPEQIADLKALESFQNDVNRIFNDSKLSTKGKKIAGAVGNFTAKNAPKVGNYVAQSFKKDAASMAALVGFTANLAGSGNVVTSMVAAAGAYEATDSFMKNSKGTVSSGVDKDFQTLENITGEELDVDDRKDGMQGIVKLGDAGYLSSSNLQNSAKDVVKKVQEIVNMLKSAGTPEQQKAASEMSQADIAAVVSRIQLRVDQGVQIDKAVKDSVKESSLGNTAITSEQEQKIKDAVQPHLQMVTQAGLYQKYKTAKGMNISVGDLVGRKAGHFQGGTQTIRETTTVEEETTVEGDSFENEKKDIADAGSDAVNAVNDAGDRVAQEIDSEVSGTQIHQKPGTPETSGTGNATRTINPNNPHENPNGQIPPIDGSQGPVGGSNPDGINTPRNQNPSTGSPQGSNPNKHDVY